MRGRRGPGMTGSHHEKPIAPIRLGPRAAPAERPNEVWAADITYVPIEEGWLDLASVLDLGGRRVVGWAMGERSDEDHKRKPPAARFARLHEAPAQAARNWIK